MDENAQSQELLRRAERIKECFRKFDVDDNGFISKNELRLLLQMLDKSTELKEEEVDQCLHEADTNGNGAIEYNEFVDWLMRPGGTIGATHSGRLEVFDLEKALKPLFKVYDRNGDGTITAEEYVECHTIMQNALKIHEPSKDDPRESLPGLFKQAAEEVFGKIDIDHNRAITFAEFVEFQREALQKSGLTNEDLAELLPALSRQLTRIFKLVDSEEQGQLDEGEEALLRKMIENVATFSRDLWNTQQENKNAIRDKVHYANRWVEPPVGLNIHDLKKKHLLLRPMRVFGVETVNVDIHCIPALPEDAENTQLLKRREVRSWLASVTVEVLFKGGLKKTTDGPYFYKYSDLTWEAAQHLGKKFQLSFEAFAPELRLYCMLRCEANFATELTWQQVTDTLRNAKKEGLMTESQIEQYVKHMELVVAQAVYEDAGVMSPGATNRERRDRLEHLVVPAHSVMLVLADLKICDVSSAWTDFIHPTQ